MNVTHRFRIGALCPAKNNWDVYECTAQMTRFMLVEELLKVAESYFGTAIYQEALCQELADKLQCAVTLSGEHSGVQTEVTCTPGRESTRATTDAHFKELVEEAQRNRESQGAKLPIGG